MPYIPAKPAVVYHLKALKTLSPGKGSGDYMKPEHYVMCYRSVSCLINIRLAWDIRELILRYYAIEAMGERVINYVHDVSDPIFICILQRHILLILAVCLVQ
jgi:hypothetical protein